MLGGWVDEEVVLEIPPEAVWLGGDLELEVVLVEALGSDLLVHLRNRRASRDGVGRVRRRGSGHGVALHGAAAANTRVAVGERLSIGVDMSRQGNDGG